MPNVLNPEPESITLNTEIETPTLDPATELEAPSPESTSNPDTADTHTAESIALDADASTEPVVEAASEQPELVHAPVAAAPTEHSADSNDDFSAALEAFEREQAAEAAAVSAFSLSEEQRKRLVVQERG